MKKNILVTYSKELFNELITPLNIDVDKVYSLKNNTKFIESKDPTNVSIAISAAVTSYGRIYMAKNQLAILNKGGSLFYTVTDMQLDDDLIHSKALGKFKQEYGGKI